MLETPHVAVGAAIATKVVNPVLSIPLALASHFVLEKVPHWNPHLNTETQKFGRVTAKSTRIVITDVLASIAIGGYFASRFLPDYKKSLIVIIACLVSVLPDVIEGPYFFLHMRNKIIEKWIYFQKSLQNDAPLIPGLLTQALVLAFCFWWILG